MSDRTRGRIALMVLAAIAMAMVVGAILKESGAVRDAELSTVDTRFDLRGEQDTGDVVIVAMDEKTLTADPNSAVIPFNRRRHARVIRQLTEAGASVIAYDLQFTEPSRFPGADDALIEALHDAPRTVLGTAEVADDGSTTIFGGGDALEYSGAAPASVLLSPGSDGAVRRMTFRFRQLETFGMAAARLHTGRRVSTPAGGGALIDYPGPPGTFERLSFVDVEYGRFSAAAVRGKVVVVGPTAPSFKDLYRTPTGDAMPGPEVHAATIATALAAFPLEESPDWVDWLLILGLGAVAPLVATRFGTAAALLAGVAAILVFLGGAWLAFEQGVILVVLPSVAAGLTGMVGALLLALPASHPWANRVLDVVSRGTGNARTRRLRAALLISTALFVTTAGLSLLAADALKRLELGTVDTRFDVRGGEPPPDDAVLVAVDDTTFSDLPRQQWPFDRRLHARVVRQLTKAGARVIAYDVQFTEEARDFEEDNALILAIRDSPRVVLSSTEVDPVDGSTNIFGGGAGLEYSRATAANGNYANDPDDRIRRMEFEADGVVTFPIAAARLAREGPIALPPGNEAWIDFAGPPPSVRRLSFSRVMKGKFPAAAVRGKIVVIGATAPTLQDLHRTATTKGALMPGPELQANAIVTALAGFPLRNSSGWINVLLVVVLAVAAPFAALRLRMAFAITIGIVAIAGLLVGAQLAFNGGSIVTVAYPLLAGVVALAATAAIHGVTVAFERANTRDAFARFVPESVVDQVLQDAEGVRLGGVRGEATVMFSDLRGFTSFAETLEPEQVIASLNRYLTAMSEAILDHGGTLVAYMGDGIMAVFGAPLKQDDHADRALAASRDMLDRLEGFNAWLRGEGLHEGFKMGIGLNSGPVMSGNVGSERRLEYTALGDTTNTAARLEGMTKGTPHQLYVADTTRQALTRPADDLVHAGEFEVRGRKAKIVLWSLAEPEPEPPVEEPAQSPAEA